MRVAGRDEPADQSLVVAAQRGDRRALDYLMAEYLPLVYNVVGRALDGHADVDDVVQETMMRAVDHLGDLRDPSAFRAWLVAIAVRQVRDRWRARQAQPVAYGQGLEGVLDAADPGADFVDLTILQLALSGQRRETALATRWLDPDDRELLALWWLEAAGELSRAELASALGVSGGHASVRVQRMRAQLDTARTVVRALSATPRCADLAAVAGQWNGVPSSSWRKQFGRHTRNCVTCAAHWQELVVADRLLFALALVPVPALLAGKWMSLALTPAAGIALAKGAAAEGAVVMGAGANALSGGGQSSWTAWLGVHASVKLVAAAAAVVVTAGAGVFYAVGGSAPEGSTAASAALPDRETTASPVSGVAASPGPSLTSSLSPSTAASSTARATTATNTPSKTGAPASSPSHFTTLAPGATLPTGSQCAAWVQARPVAENKSMNITPNHTTGRLLSGTVAPYNRVDGNFTGTTAEILRWTACKWGKDEDLVFAQAAVESWWRQDTRGDWTTDASRCPPGHGLGVDGQAGQCSQSYGILQSYYLANIQSFPEAISSTAMNADYAGAVWYACYLGIGGMGTNGVGNAEGCMSPGNIGTADHLAYLAKIKDYQNQRIWTTPNFQQP